MLAGGYAVTTILATSVNWLFASDGFMILMYIFESFLDVRQHAAHKLPTLAKHLVGVISQKKIEKSRAYSLDKSYFHFVQEFVTILMDCSILYFRILPWFWKRSGEFMVNLGLNAENEIYHTLSFLAGVMVWSQITDLPFSLYSTFVIEARHGFNKQTMWLFFRDMIKGIVLAIVIGPPIVAAIIVIVQKGGPYLAIYLWGFMLILSLVMMTIYPVLIAPLFNKFTPLPQGELRLKIENLASSLKFPLKKLFVVDGSTRYGVLALSDKWACDTVAFYVICLLIYRRTEPNIYGYGLNLSSHWPTAKTGQWPNVDKEKTVGSGPIQNGPSQDLLPKISD
ncbi:hypothetical protein RND71_040771 [Anisodus tanguticus]|uniref:CAAX prenyl protease n=1 Tax=Anisodus tanguticus TaxID=243964 RepID=A0AAE1UW29_9SOLA|nr:hypothetical protein RND71_040771 [Anisodus tanguticus]